MSRDAALLTVLTAAEKATRPKSPLTVSEWADGNRLLTSESSAEAGEWRTSRVPYLREIMDCLSEDSPVRKVVFQKSSQVGGPLALDTPIPTADGWTTMEQIRHGDVIFDETGAPCRVTYVSPVFEGRQCFQIVFSDGACFVADDQHRWTVCDDFPGHKGKKRGSRNSRVATLTTLEIAQTYRVYNRNRYAIPVCGALELPEADLPIPPYLLGAWLANGNSSGNQITVHEEDAAEVAGLLQASGAQATARKMPWDKGRAANILFRLPGKPWLPALRAIGMESGKRIPSNYLRASHDQRLALLRGLMDGDGNIDGRGRCEYSSANRRLFDGVLELARGLGLKPSVCEVQSKGFGTAAPKTDGRHYRLSFIAYADQPVFDLARKRARQPEQAGRRVSETKRRRIVEVIPCDSVPVRCIGVDSPSHLYLAGSHMVATHNTEAGVNWIGYIMAHAKGPTAIVMPTEKALSDWMSQKFDPMAAGTPAVRDVLASRSNRAGDNSAARKRFTGGIFYAKTAGSTTELKSTSLRYAIADEVDEYDWTTLQGNPLALLEVRQKTFHDRKLFVVSSPTVKDASRIEEQFELGDQRRFMLPCPHCGHRQHLVWGNVRWSVLNHHVTRAWYVCQDCGAEIDEHQKPAMLAAGKWQPHNPDALWRSYHINALYAPLGIGETWSELATQWLLAQNDLTKLVAFINTVLGETWADRSRDIKVNDLLARVEPYSQRTVPPGCLVMTAGVDVQDDRLEIQITGWGSGNRSWELDYHVLHGSPTSDALWMALAQYINGAVFENAYGKQLRIEATAIDTGGHHTHMVYAFVRSGAVRRPLACKGASTPGKVILGKPSKQDVNLRGQTVKKGVHLYLVGTDTAKALLYGRLHDDADQPPELRKVHFSHDLESSYFDQLVSETYNPRKQRWELKKGKRNEALDTWVLSLAASHHPELHVHKWTKLDWQRRAAMLEPEAVPAAVSPEPESTAAPPPPTAKPARAPAPARTGNGFASGDWMERL